MTEKKKSTKKTKGTKSLVKAQSMMKKCAKAWNASEKKGKYTDFVRKYFKEHKNKKK